MSKQGFKVVGRYLYPMIESTKTFTTRAAAAKEARRWKKQAESEGMHMTARVVPANAKAP